MRIPSGVFVWITFFHVTDALYTGKFCPSACDFTLNYVTFNDTDASLSRKIRSCRSKLRTTSLYLCFDQYCAKDGSSAQWIAEQSPWCNDHAGVGLPNLEDVVRNWTVHDIAKIRRLDADEAKWSSSLVVDEVVLPDLHFFDRAFTTMVCQLACILRPERLLRHMIGCSISTIQSSFGIWAGKISTRARLALTVTAGVCTTSGS
jgi:hypothetical protein